jgi:two-component system response regulator ChvI
VIERILVVDDDLSLVTILSAALAEEGFAVEHARDGAEGLRRFEAAPPDLVILDVLLPELDGLAVLRRIRARATTPIILLSSRGEEVDRVSGLELGADDYVTKPFSTRELCARIRAVERRLGGGRVEEAAPVAAGALRIDPARFEARWKDAPVALTRSELELLLHLVRRRGLVLGRERLLDLMRGEDVTVTERTVDTFIKRIRRKLRDVDPEFDEIETVFGVGYRYRT